MSRVEEFLKQRTKEINARCYQKRKEKLKERYQNDTEYRERHLQYSKEYYYKKKSDSN